MGPRELPICVRKRIRDKRSGAAVAKNSCARKRNLSSPLLSSNTRKRNAMETKTTVVTSRKFHLSEKYLRSKVSMGVSMCSPSVEPRCDRSSGLQHKASPWFRAAVTLCYNGQHICTQVVYDGSLVRDCIDQVPRPSSRGRGSPLMLYRHTFPESLPSLALLPLRSRIPPVRARRYPRRRRITGGERREQHCERLRVKNRL